MCDHSAYNLNDSSCWSNVIFNYDNPTPEQKKNALDFVRANFMKIIEKNNFLQMDKKTFVELLRPDELNVSSEDVVFECVKRWLTFNNISRYFGLQELLEVVRMPYITPECFITNVMPYVCDVESCHSFIAETLRWHLIPKDRSKLTSIRTKPRKPTNYPQIEKKPHVLNSSTKLLSVGSLDYSTSAVVELYDSEENKWRQLKNLDIEMRNYCAAIVGDKLIIAGGYRKGKAYKSVESVDLNDGSITHLNPMNEGRHNLGLAVVVEGNSNVLYAIGGTGDGLISKTVEKLDPVTHNWSYVAPMHETRKCVGVAVLNNKIYAAGGFTGTVYRRSVEMYDATADSWTMKCPMNKIRSLCCLTAAGNYLYAIAGHNGTYGTLYGINTVERYDPMTDSWTNIANVSSRGLVGAGCLGNSPVAVGGISSNIVEVYEEEHDRWKKLAPINVARALNYVVQVPQSMVRNEFNW